MKKIICLPIFIVFFVNTIDAQNELKYFFDSAEKLFQKYVDNGRVNYQDIKDDPKDLNAVIKHIENANLRSLSKETQKTFWINAYNIITIKAIVNNYPIISPKKVSGFFDVIKHKTAGESLTLDDIENKKLRIIYKDPRIYFVLVNGAMGCSKIVNFAYKPEKLEIQLNQQTREAVNDRNFIRVNSTERKVEISELFKWHEKDFATIGRGIIQFINEYRIHHLIPSNYSVSYYTYDWRLNEKKGY